MIALPARGHITHDVAFQCSVDGCPLKYDALGLCNTHYRQQWRRESAESAWVPAAPKRRRVLVRGIVRWEAVK